MKKRMIPLLLLLSSHFLLAVYGRDSQKEQSRVVVIAIEKTEELEMNIIFILI